MDNGPQVHGDFDRNSEVEISSERSFAAVFVVVFIAIAVWPLLDGKEVLWWSAGVAALIGLVGLVTPGALAPLNRLWAKFGLFLHKIVNPIIMGGFYPSRYLWHGSL